MTRRSLPISRQIRACLLIVVVASLPGCMAVAERPVWTGRVTLVSERTGLQPGDRAPDFSFRAEDDTLYWLSSIHSRVKVVVVDSDEDWLAGTDWRALPPILDKASTRDVGVVAILVGRPPNSCDAANERIESAAVRSDRLLMICDLEGKIADLYGPQSRGTYYVLDEYGTILATGNYANAGSIRDDVVAAVAAITHEDLQIKLRDE